MERLVLSPPCEQHPVVYLIDSIIDFAQDHPPKPEDIHDWEQELKDIGRMQGILESHDVALKVLESSEYSQSLLTV